MSNINVKNIYRGRRMSRVRIGGVGSRRNVLDDVVCSREQFSFQMCLESGDGSGTFRSWRLMLRKVPLPLQWRQRVPDSGYRDTECWQRYATVLLAVLYQVLNKQVPVPVVQVPVQVPVLGMQVQNKYQYW